MRKLILLGPLLLLLACWPPRISETGLWKIKLGPAADVRAVAELDVIDTIPELDVVIVASEADPGQQLAGFVYVEPVVKVLVPPYTIASGTTTLWNLRKVRAPETWPISRGEGIGIAIIDTGVYADPDEFPGYDQADCVSFVPDEDCRNNHPHGTHVASIAMGQHYGMAPGARLVAIKALSTNGSGLDYYIAQAIVRAAQTRGTRVINLSLGSSTRSQTMCDAVSFAVERNVLVAAASGNNRGTEAAWPAACPDAIAVGATTSEDTRAWFSNGFSNKPEAVVAPGEAIVAWLPDGPQAWNGTSMASPHVAGLGALVAYLSPEITQAAFFLALRETSQDLGQTGFDIGFGHGRIDALAAALFSRGQPLPTPLPTRPPGSPTPAPPISTPTLPAYPSPQPPPTPTPRVKKTWLELIMRNYPATNPSILVVLNAWRDNLGLDRLIWDERLTTAAALVAGDGTYCPQDKEPIEFRLGRALAQVGYKEKRGWALALCGQFADELAVLDYLEAENAGPRWAGLSDAGAIHLAHLDLERPGGDRVSDVWVLVAGEPGP